MRWHTRGYKTIYSCEEPQKSKDLLTPTIVTRNRFACKYYEEKEK